MHYASALNGMQPISHQMDHKTGLGGLSKVKLGNIVGFITATIHQDGDAHIAYGIGSRFWGNGYAKSAAEQLLSLLAKNYSVHQFCIITERENTRSVLLARKIGFVEVTSEVERQKNSLGQSEILLHKLAH